MLWRQPIPELIQQVADISTISRDLSMLPAGMDTQVGETGVTLSGGQKQRIAISRALAIDAPILILDDALSAVDSESEETILNAIIKNRSGRTTILISHRVSALRRCQQIAVLEAGVITNIGTHKALLATPGFYRSISTLCSRWKLPRFYSDRRQHQSGARPGPRFQSDNPSTLDEIPAPLPIGNNNFATGIAITAASQLAIPVVLQHTIDRYFLQKWQRIAAANVPEATEAQVDFEDTIVVGDKHYLPKSALTGVSGIDLRALEESLILEPELYYLFSGATAREIIDSYPETEQQLVVEGDYGVIAVEQMTELPQPIREQITADDRRAIGRRSLQILLLLLVSLLFGFLQNYFTAYCGQSVMRDLRIELFGHALQQSSAFFTNQKTGKLVSRISNDVETINELFTNVIVELLKNITLMIGVVITLFIINVRLGIITALTLPPILIVTWLFRGLARRAFRRVRELVSRINAFLSEYIRGIAIVQMFSQEKRTAKRFGEEKSDTGAG